ncbi:hypothetical protein SELSPUOL_01011 [Selenomonas sputigena ATCC 35185]|uniref:Uncharacterized protein n=1 Tax=Selenomonas sputigena (strain ATCC 35185 / DSM 20758 / CCUG 44933 / VPI D19B-28) TaxID=546271 RepID=C9LTK0_SELS3|nr:hypothetical protein SELSPUOL_01011 [Selenomonas sputigena ATCC 35185]
MGLRLRLGILGLHAKILLFSLFAQSLLFPAKMRSCCMNRIGRQLYEIVAMDADSCGLA